MICMIKSSQGRTSLIPNVSFAVLLICTDSPPVDITRIPLRTVSNMWPFYCALRFIMKNKPETRQKLCRTVRQMLIGVSSAAFPSRNSIILSVESLLLGHKNGQQRQYMHSISWSTRMVQGFLKTIF